VYTQNINYNALVFGNINAVDRRALRTTTSNKTSENKFVENCNKYFLANLTGLRLGRISALL
jgi:hypothetical protein